MYPNFPRKSPLLVLGATAIMLQCAPEEKGGDLYLPDGFTSSVVIEQVDETVRHLAVSEEHVVYAKLRNAEPDKAVMALLDTNGDDYADETAKFGGTEKGSRWSYATAMRVYNGYIYLFCKNNLFNQL